MTPDSLKAGRSARQRRARSPWWGNGSSPYAQTFPPAAFTSSATGDDSSSSSSSSSGMLQRVKTVFIISLAGIAIIFGLVFLTYGMTWLADKFCSYTLSTPLFPQQRDDHDGDGDGDDEEGFEGDGGRNSSGGARGRSSRGRHRDSLDRGPICRKAGLYGMRQHERMAILQYLFVTEGKVITYQELQQQQQQTRSAAEQYRKTTQQSENR